MNTWNIQQAIYAKLSADATLLTLVSGVFDEVPPDQAFPYVALGESTATPDDLLIDVGNQATFTLYVWDDQPTYKRIKLAMDRIDTLLHRKALTIAGTQFVSMVRELADTLRDIDSERRRGIMRYRVTTFG